MRGRTDVGASGGRPPTTTPRRRSRRPHRGGAPSSGAGAASPPIIGGDPSRSRHPAKRGDRDDGDRDRHPTRDDGSKERAGPPIRRDRSNGGTVAAPDGGATVPTAADDVLVRRVMAGGAVGAGGGGGGDDGTLLVDLPKERINDLPEVPYRRTKNAAVVVSNASESERAVCDIRAELMLSTAARRRRRREEGNGDGIPDDDDDDDDDENDANSFQYVGFDTETKPKFNRGGENHPPALVQIATESTAYLFRLTFGGGCVMTDSLMKLLSDPSVIKVGIGVLNDARELNRVHGRDCCGDGSSYLDLGPLAGMRWPNVRRTGLRNLTATVLGYRLSKAQQMKNWEMAHLTPAMEAYAAADAHVALDLLAAIVGEGRSIPKWMGNRT